VIRYVDAQLQPTYCAAAFSYTVLGSFELCMEDNAWTLVLVCYTHAYDTLMLWPCAQQVETTYMLHRAHHGYGLG